MKAVHFTLDNFEAGVVLLHDTCEYKFALKFFAEPGHPFHKMPVVIVLPITEIESVIDTIRQGVALFPESLRNGGGA